MYCDMCSRYAVVTVERGGGLAPARSSLARVLESCKSGGNCGAIIKGKSRFSVWRQY